MVRIVSAAANRVRSPAYPFYNLEQAIGLIRKIYEKDRLHPVDREVAAQHLGFSGKTGSSDRAISAIYHYGLAEKAVKGELRVTNLALRILHPTEDCERREALHEAGFNPQLFKELRQRYSGSLPALATLESYLTRQGFAMIAIGPAAKAYLETCQFLQREAAYESDGQKPSAVSESSSDRRDEEPRTMHHQLPAVMPQPGANALASTVRSALRSDVFTLQGGGEVIVMLPETLSPSEYEDLKDWLTLIERKTARKVVAPTLELTPPEADEAELDEEEAERASLL